MSHRNRFRILVPQKALDRAKTRLRSVLEAEARVGLTLQMLRRTLGVCREVPGHEGVILDGPAELEPLAREFGVVMFPGGLEGMRRDVAAAGAAAAGEDYALLIVSSDLPLINVPDLQRVVDTWRSGYEVVLVPDRRRRGTNVMMVDHPESFPFAFGGAFGTGSLETHLTQSYGTNLAVTVLELPALGLDLDLPADLADFVREAPGDPLAAYCLEHRQEDFMAE